MQRGSGIGKLVWLFGACLLCLPSTSAPAAQVILRSLPTSCATLGNGLGRFHAGPAQWTIEGSGENSFFGATLTRPRDLDGDGPPEWAVAAPKAYENGHQVGRIWLLSFPPASLPQVRWTWTNSRSGEWTGHALAWGDFNGDGFADLACGFPFARRAGRVALFAGSRTNFPNEWSWSKLGSMVGLQQGASLAVCDVNRDGFADLLFSQPGWTGKRGRVLLRLGSAKGLSPEADWIVTGNSAREMFGETMAVLDANGDGRPDLAVGSPYFSEPGRTNMGRVQLFPGTNSFFASVPVWTYVGASSNAGFGRCLNNLGDLDKDGREELGVGAPGVQERGKWNGAASIFRGTAEGLEREPMWQSRGSDRDCGWGRSVENVGDVNGDGWPDVAVGGCGLEPKFTVLHGSWVHLFLGGPHGLAKEAHWRLLGSHACTGTGWSLARLGDLNGDGLADVAVASPVFPLITERTANAGRIDIFLGRKEGYGAGQTFPMDGINSSTIEEAVADWEGGLAKVNEGNRAAIRDQLANVSAVMRETKRVQTANVSARHWLRWIGWASPGVALAVGLLGVRQRRRAAAEARHRERTRLARDLHDGVGSCVHRIFRLTEQLNRTSADPAAEQRCREELFRTAQELHGSVNETVWFLKPENDTLENFVTGLAGHAPKVLKPQGIDCELDLPPQLPPLVLEGGIRRQIFLAVNEALNNVAKHAQARRVWLRVSWESPWLEIAVEDDGCGFKPDATRGNGLAGGNGLGNLRARMEALGGRTAIKARDGGGTRLTIRLPLSDAVRTASAK